MVENEEVIEVKEENTEALEKKRLAALNSKRLKELEQISKDNLTFAFKRLGKDPKKMKAVEGSRRPKES